MVAAAQAAAQDDVLEDELIETKFSVLDPAPGDAMRAAPAQPAPAAAAEVLRAHDDAGDEGGDMPDEAAHAAAAAVVRAESSASMASKIAQGRDQLQLLEQRLQDKAAEIVRLRGQAASGGGGLAGSGSGSKLGKAMAAQAALQRLMDDARQQHEKLKANFERLHTSPYTSPRQAPRPAPVEDMQLPASSLAAVGGGGESGASSPLGSLADMHALTGSGEEANQQTAGGLGMVLSKEHNGIQIVVITAGSPAARSAGVFRGNVLFVSVSVSVSVDTRVCMTMTYR